jgi:peroxiredoxin
VQVQDRQQEFDALGVQIVAIAFVTPERLRSYLGAHPLPFRALADPDRSAYQALGLGRAGWSRLFGWNVLRAYAGLLWRGRKLERAREDVRQLGGDFLLDAHGEIVFAYRSRDPADRPSVDDLLAAVRRNVQIDGAGGNESHPS